MLNENVKKMRIGLSMTQQQLAKKIGVSQNIISSVENGTKIPSLAVAVNLAEIFECTLDELVDRKPQNS